MVLDHVRSETLMKSTGEAIYFIKDLKEHFGKDERLITSEIRDRDAIVGSIRDFLGKGK